MVAVAGLWPRRRCDFGSVGSARPRSSPVAGRAGRLPVRTYGSRGADPPSRAVGAVRPLDAVKTGALDVGPGAARNAGNSPVRSSTGPVVPVITSPKPIDATSRRQRWRRQMTAAQPTRSAPQKISPDNTGSHTAQRGDATDRVRSKSPAGAPSNAQPVTGRVCVGSGTPGFTAVRSWSGRSG